MRPNSSLVQLRLAQAKFLRVDKDLEYEKPKNKEAKKAALAEVEDILRLSISLEGKMNFETEAATPAAPAPESTSEVLPAISNGSDATAPSTGKLTVAAKPAAAAAAAGAAKKLPVNAVASGKASAAASSKPAASAKASPVTTVKAAPAASTGVKAKATAAVVAKAPAAKPGPAAAAAKTSPTKVRPSIPGWPGGNVLCPHFIADGSPLIISVALAGLVSSDERDSSIDDQVSIDSAATAYAHVG